MASTKQIDSTFTYPKGTKVVSAHHSGTAGTISDGVEITTGGGWRVVIYEEELRPAGPN